MDLLNIFTGESGDLLQQMAMLNYLNSGEKDMLQKVTGARVAVDLWKRLTGEEEIDALRNQTILSISKYVKDHPNAKKEELVKEIGKQIYLFQKNVENM